ncbi:MAG TPA: hypothetical protein VNX25_03405 [Verrucomicrobiae bacterium]|nr:hypothetical protein [Verrucomicrobiae bacterium]
MTGGMGGGWSGGGPTAGGGAANGAWQCAGPGYGTAGAGSFRTGMLGLTMKQGYLDVLSPVATADAAVAAVESFIAAAGSTLRMSELWEYRSVYKAELTDAGGQRAFDLVVDKLTGSVLPEMGMSMMMNASWGKQLQATPKFAKKLVLTPADAVAAAENFLARNARIISYALAPPEVYPGYYRFHTTDTATGSPGMDIMVNGYSGGIWMNTQLGPPLAQIR